MEISRGKSTEKTLLYGVNLCCVEFITHSFYGADIIVAKLFANFANVYINGSIGYYNRIFPDTFQNHVAGIYFTRLRGKAAETLFNSIKFYKNYTLIECQPITGRMHQIRIHLASQRAAIAGDDMYGGQPVLLSNIKRGYRLGKDQEELPIMKRFALHAKEVTFKINDTDEITVEAPYPKDFATLLKLLDKFDV